MLSSSAAPRQTWGWSWSSNNLATWCKESTHWKRPWCWKYWRQEEKGITEDEMFGWHHWLDRHEFEQALGVGDGQGSLVCCSPWGHKESDMTEWLNNNNKMWIEFISGDGITSHFLFMLSLMLQNFSDNYFWNQWGKHPSTTVLYSTPEYQSGKIWHHIFAQSNESLSVQPPQEIKLNPIKLTHCLTHKADFICYLCLLS